MRSPGEATSGLRFMAGCPLLDECTRAAERAAQLTRRLTRTRAAVPFLAWILQDAGKRHSRPRSLHLEVCTFEQIESTTVG
jgi:hypothetical protein